MSSKEHRMSTTECPSWPYTSFESWLFISAFGIEARNAAVNARHLIVPGLAFAAGGGRRERSEPAGSADRGGAVARQSRCGAGAVVHCRRRVLPGRGQGSGQVRDA